MSRSSPLSSADAKFQSALLARGAEVLAPTNEWEIMRFKTRYGVGVVYTTARGARTWNAAAKQAREHISKQAAGTLAPVTVRGRRNGRGTVNRIIARDGDECFFCRAPLDDDITVEHLVPIAHGGPNHISNLFLAHSACNQMAGHMSAPEKIAVAIKASMQGGPR